MSLPPVDRSLPWRPTSADLYSTGASGAAPVRPVNPVTPVESTDGIGRGAGLARGNAEADAANRTRADGVNVGWTERGQAAADAAAAAKPDEQKKPDEPPLHKQLMEFLQSIWRASANAVDAADAIRQQNAEAREQQAQANKPITYGDPTVKRSSKV